MKSDARYDREFANGESGEVSGEQKDGYSPAKGVWDSEKDRCRRGREGRKRRRDGKGWGTRGGVTKQSDEIETDREEPTR
jgi:hypothetical protein